MSKLKRRSIIVAPGGSFRFPACCSISKLQGEHEKGSPRLDFCGYLDNACTLLHELFTVYTSVKQETDIGLHFATNDNDKIMLFQPRQPPFQRSECRLHQWSVSCWL